MEWKSVWLRTQRPPCVGFLRRERLAVPGAGDMRAAAPTVGERHRSMCPESGSG